MNKKKPRQKWRGFLLFICGFIWWLYRASFAKICMKEGGFLYNQNWNASVPNYGYNRNQNMDWIIVPTVDQIAQVTVQPNQRAWIMAQNEPVFALRSADSMGLVNTEYYRFEKMNSNALNASSNALDALEKRIEALERMVNNESTIQQ